MVAILDCPASDRLTLTQLARQQKVAPATTWRWARRGVCGIKLPVVYVGSKPYTSSQAFAWWCDEVTAAKRGDKPVSSRTNKQRERDVAAAEAELRAEGIL